jgi:hypothetical protein
VAPDSSASVLFGMQNRTFGRYMAAIHRILIPGVTTCTSRAAWWPGTRRPRRSALRRRAWCQPAHKPPQKSRWPRTRRAWSRLQHNDTVKRAGRYPVAWTPPRPQLEPRRPTPSWSVPGTKTARRMNRLLRKSLYQISRLEDVSHTGVIGLGPGNGHRRLPFRTLSVLFVLRDAAAVRLWKGRQTGMCLATAYCKLCDSFSAVRLNSRAQTGRLKKEDHGSALGDEERSRKLGMKEFGEAEKIQMDRVSRAGTLTVLRSKVRLQSMHVNF